MRTTYGNHAFGSFSSPARASFYQSSRLKVYYLMDYLPKRYDATWEQEQDRQAIYAFKDGNCGRRILDGLVRGVRRLADSDTVVCFVPASTEWKTANRYTCVARRLREETGVRCSLSAITRPEDGEAGHIGGKSADPAADYSFDPSFFSGKKVILVDDVITRGTTLESVARRLRAGGAREVVGLVAGKTTNPDWNGGEDRNLERL